MKGRIERRGLVTVNRTLTGILAAAMVMSNLTETGGIVQAAETKRTVENDWEMEAIEATTEEIYSEMMPYAEEQDSEEETTIESIIEIETEANKQEEGTTEASVLKETTDEGDFFASVYLQFDSQGGNCDIAMIELTPDNTELTMPQAEKAGYRFTGWYMNPECTMAFTEDHIFWEAGNTYVLYAGYEQIALAEVKLMERTLQQSIDGVTITVEGNMPAEAALEVRTEELTREEQEHIVEESDMIDSTDSLHSQENTFYSYDISLRYLDVEYEPYFFDEKMEVTFSFADAQELQNVQQMEVFHIDDNENVEKIEIMEASESEVSFEADAFSTYILITKVEYSGNKNWTYEFTGDVQTFTAPVSGQYVFECYGAGIDSSKGSFAKGTIGLEKNETVYIYVGGQNHTFNGGGQGGEVWHSASNSGGSFHQNVISEHGCGATDVRVSVEVENRMIVAGGGGGNGHNGGVVYSYNGSTVSDGPAYYDVKAQNQVMSNEVLGQGSDYETSVSSGVWGTGKSYPDRGTYSTRTVTGGGGGGYYGGKSGYAGTSKVISALEYQGKEYQASDYVIENLVYTGNGKCQVSLYSLEADVITYYNHNMTKLGEAAGLTGSYVNYPTIEGIPTRASDSKYDYTYRGWDDMATEEIEYYTDAQTVAAAMNGDRNYIAAYESVGKSYAVKLDSADAQSTGTTEIRATYHSTLPDIIIPAKEGSIFAGYYTGQNGSGTQVYSADGKGVTLSVFDQESIIYAHWVQPIVNVTNPQDKEVLTGYAGVVLTTEADLDQPIGYLLSYQWYINHENSNVNGSPMEAADSRKLVIPQGFQPGQYYFYCLITATNTLNGQAVSILTTPAQLCVEKGIMGMEQVEVETKECVYDGTRKSLKAAINNSNPHTIYYGTEPLNAENYKKKGSIEPNSYTDAGIYTNYIYVTGLDFADFSGSIRMIIQKAEPQVYLPSKNTAYNGQIQTVDAARVYDVNDKKMEMLVAYVYFMDEACTKKTDTSCGALTEGGAPSAVGTYYVHAVTEETINYHDVATKTPAMFNILGTNVKYSISGYHGMYDGKPHGLQIVNEDERNATIYFSDSIALTKDNYQIAGTVVPFEYKQIGRYPIYYIVVTKLVGGIDQYETGMAEIVIEAVKQNVGDEESGSDKNSGDYDNNDGGNVSDSTPNDNQQDKVELHKHNYELISLEEPTIVKEGKAVYRCIECGHELVITYPVKKDENIVPDSKTDIEEEKSKTEAEGASENTKDKKLEEKLSELESSEGLSDEVKKALSEAELLRIAETLKSLSEDEIRDLYEKGFLNVTWEEFERLLAMIRTQTIIDEEKVSLSENLLSAEVDENSEHVDNAKKQNVNMWNSLWAFFLGVAVMFFIRKMMEVRKSKQQKEVASLTRKLK